MSSVPTYEQICADAGCVGLACCGGFQLMADDSLPEIRPGVRPATLILLGFRGPSCWLAFEASAEFRDGQAHPLDRWSRRLIDELARRHAALSVYPFSGPPWWPFQSWAARAEGLHASPLGILMHPKFGPWHSYRGALLFETRIDVPAAPPVAHPCDSCHTKPCLHGCPVGAVSEAGFDALRCREFVRSRGRDCREGGCLARRSCPVGAEYQQSAAQASFHIAAFAGLRAISAR
ncbi:MAG: ferredoxin [Proteobacteria bacterium]|nr:ferredoxin [Pseudomonadota bacterium]